MQRKYTLTELRRNYPIGSTVVGTKDGVMQIGRVTDYYGMTYAPVGRYPIVDAQVEIQQAPHKRCLIRICNIVEQY